MGNHNALESLLLQQFLGFPSLTLQTKYLKFLHKVLVSRACWFPVFPSPSGSCPFLKLHLTGFRIAKIQVDEKSIWMTGLKRHTLLEAGKAEALSRSSTTASFQSELFCFFGSLLKVNNWKGRKVKAIL